MRRRLGLLTALLIVAALGGTAEADFISAPDVVIYCDPALVASMGAVGADFRARTGVPVRVFGSPGTLLLGLLERGTRDDVVVTVKAEMDRAAALSLVRPETRAGAWRDPVVLASRDAPAVAGPVDVAAFTTALADGRLAVIDPVAPDRMDGPATVGRLGWSAAANGRTDGFPSGQEVAFVVERGAARLGLLHRSDLAGHAALAAIGTAPAEAAAPAEYAAAIGRNVLSRNSEAFMAYLNGPEATGRLARDGLEKVP